MVHVGGWGLSRSQLLVSAAILLLVNMVAWFWPLQTADQRTDTVEHERWQPQLPEQVQPPLEQMLASTEWGAGRPVSEADITEPTAEGELSEAEVVKIRSQLQGIVYRSGLWQVLLKTDDQSTTEGGTGALTQGDRLPGTPWEIETVLPDRMRLQSVEQPGSAPKTLYIFDVDTSQATEH